MQAGSAEARVLYVDDEPSLCRAFARLFRQDANVVVATASSPQEALTLLERDGELRERLDRVRTLYRERRDALAAGLRARLGDRVSFALPDGGFFLWAAFPGVDSAALLTHAVRPPHVHFFTKLDAAIAAARDKVETKPENAPPTASVM